MERKTEHIRFEVRDGVAQITLDRAEQLNAFSGTMGRELGLASRLLPAEEVLPAALELARDIAENAAPLSVAVTKKLLWESPGLSAQEIGRRETELHHHLMGREDAIEGAVAYLERRKPRWKLRVSRDWPEWPR